MKNDKIISWVYLIGLWIVSSSACVLLFSNDLSAGYTHRVSVEEMRSLYNEDTYPYYDDGVDGPYVDMGNGIITDLGTGLMWQQIPAPYDYSWNDACQLCEDLVLGNYSDWELPDIKQLVTLIDRNYYSATNYDYFRGSGGTYWSGSKLDRDYNGAYYENVWTVVFHSYRGTLITP